MGDRLKHKVAVVTGGGRGIGRAIALALAEEGSKVVANDLGGALDGTGASTAPADEVVAEIKKGGGEAVANYDTVATVEGGDNIIHAALDHFGRIDILVNNAGITRHRMVFNMAPEEWDAVIKVHLYGTFNCTRPAAALMRQQRSGRIINVTSIAGLTGEGATGWSNYAAAKAGIAGFTRVCAKDLGKYGITVNAISPGAATRMLLDWQASYKEQQPEDVAPVVVFLATEAAASISGCIFGVQGGRVDLFTPPVPVKSLYKDGRWTLDELLRTMPATLAAGLVNPAPPEQKTS